MNSSIATDRPFQAALADGPGEVLVVVAAVGSGGPGAVARLDDQGIAVVPGEGPGLLGVLRPDRRRGRDVGRA